MEPIQATPMMGAVGLDWSGVRKFAEQAIRLIQDHGDTFLSMIDSGFRAFKAVTMRDFLGIMDALNDAVVDLNKLIAAIKAEFGIE